MRTRAHILAAAMLLLCGRAFAATYYVDAAGGSDSNAGTSTGAAKQTLSAGVGLITSSSDLLYVKASASYNETLTLQKASGSVTYRIEGYTSTPGDGGQFTIDAQNTRSQCVLLDNSTPLHLKNAILQNSAQDGIANGSVNTDNRVLYLENVTSRNNARYGIYQCSPYMRKCLIQGNTTAGIMCFSVSAIFDKCVFTGNGQAVSSVAATTSHTAYDCIFDNQTNASANALFDNIAGLRAYRCIFSRAFSTKPLIRNNTTSNASIYLEDCILYSPGTTSALITAAPSQTFNPANWQVRDCGVYPASATVLDSNITAAGGVSSTITASNDPFPNIGSLNFTIASGSPWLAVMKSLPGVTPSSYLDLGAIQSQGSGGSTPRRPAVRTSGF